LNEDEPTPETTSSKPISGRRLGGSFRWLAYMGLVLAIISGIQWWRASALRGGEAPPLAGDLLANGAFDLAAPGSKPVLVYFWASWCPVCRLNNGGIDAIAQDHKVITVAVQSGTAAEVGQYLQEESLSYPVINDADGTLADQWGVSGVPASFLVRDDGRIAFGTVGYISDMGMRARLWASRILD
jgi:thiol-disulfide isomerase/thioredoxin